MLQNLHALDLNHNELSGGIPFTIGNLSQLIDLFLDYNSLSGFIPASLGHCQNLVLVNLQSNKLTGSIPKEILTITTLSRGLLLALNSLTGPIPPEVGSLKNLIILDVSMNKLSGEIPGSLGGCQELQRLYFNGNFFNGSIPSSFSALRGIQELDLSENNLSGKIPDFLQDFHFLINLNLSYNNFEGAVPRYGVFSNISEFSVLGNDKLCGGNPRIRLPACPIQSPHRKHHSHLSILITSVVIPLFLVTCYLVACFWKQKSKRKHLGSTPTIEQERVSYAELVTATNGFSEDNLIGCGSFARVYKGTLHGDHAVKIVAVKVLNLQVQGASKSFIAECEALRNIRHRNLVKVIAVCSSIDFRGNEFKALVLEFMDNASLDEWLHPKQNGQSEQKRLTLVQRLNIAIDVALALDYLHHYCKPPIIHCDLKPSNVLLDNDMTAHVSDFGLARMLKKAVSNSSPCSTSSAGLKGTIGYVPPEYGMANKVSSQGDVYSYGILLMEIFTAKNPTADIFMGGLSLRKFVEMALPQQVTDVIDTQLLSLEDDEETKHTRSLHGARRVMECVASVLRIGILCSNEVPVERPEMGEVIMELNKIRDAFLVN